MFELEKALKAVQLLICDIDGVFTDGSLIAHEDGTESKAFHVHDGAGIKFLMSTGIKTAVISGRKSAAVEHRATELGIDEIYQGEDNKINAFRRILKSLHILEENVVYVGDDLPDIPVMELVGIPIAVANARPEVKSRAKYITENSGGCGAIREVAELILKAQNQWDKIVQQFLS